VLHRFYSPDVRSAGGEVTLSDTEADHLRVLRLQVGDEVRVFDGEGHEFAARVSSADRSDVCVRIADRVTPAAEMRTRLTLVQSVLKGDKMDEVIRDAVMLGVDAVQPIVSDRADVPLAGARARHERWTRIALSSTKQCGRARITRIDPAVTFDEWIRRAGRGAAFVLVEPGVTASGARRLREVLTDTPDRLSLVVGPEGGWTPEEIGRAWGDGIALVTLGPRTLRADAVALVALSVLTVALD
jgi:16S rRNA (uracil1498-N3)-methyltransferase